MNTDVTIYGFSDDIIEIEGVCQGCDEYNAENATFLVGGERGRIYVTVAYEKRGVWSIAVSPTTGNVPTLPVEFPKITKGYSAEKLPNSAVAIVSNVDHVVRIYDA